MDKFSGKNLSLVASQDSSCDFNQKRMNRCNIDRWIDNIDDKIMYNEVWDWKTEIEASASLQNCF